MEFTESGSVIAILSATDVMRLSWKATRLFRVIVGSIAELRITKNAGRVCRFELQGADASPSQQGGN